MAVTVGRCGRMQPWRSAISALRRATASAFAVADAGRVERAIDKVAMVMSFGAGAGLGSAWRIPLHH
jgi:hypothetical protein